MSNIVLFDTPRKPRPWWMAAGIVPVAAYQAKGAASLAASYINLANPGVFNAAPGVAPTWAAATGWTFNGTTQFLDTGITPVSGYSMACQFSGLTVTGNHYLISELAGASGTYFGLGASNGNGMRYGSGGLVTVNPVITSGNIAVAGQQGYRNGVADGGAIAAWSGAATAALTIGKRAAGDFLAGNISAIVAFSSTLTQPQVASLSAAMAAL